MKNKIEYNTGVFLIMLLLSMLIAFIGNLPYVGYIGTFFAYFETFFHEMAHAMTSLLLDGNVHSVILNPEGGGACYTSHNNPYTHGIVGITGYLGASFFGALIFMSDRLFKKRQVEFKACFVSFLLVSLLYFEFTTTNLLIGALVPCYFLFAYFQKSEIVEKLMVKFIGLCIMTIACMSPMALMDYYESGDHMLVMYYLEIDAVTITYVWLVVAAVVLATCVMIEHIKLLTIDIEKINKEYSDGLRRQNES